MELSELVRDAIASLNNGNYRAASNIAKEIARLGGSMDSNYKEKALERIQKLEQDAIEYDTRGDTTQASSIVAEVERWRRSLGADETAPTNPVTDRAIKELDPDKYLGTLGLLADAPQNAPKPHYTGFPAADSGGWLRVVSKAKINGLDVLVEQNWLCTVDGTIEGKAENWTLIRPAPPTVKDLEIITYPDHPFVPGNILRKSDTAPFWYLAYLTEFSLTTFSAVLALGNFGNILVTETTKDTFSVPRNKGLVTLQNHQLGAVGDILLLDWSTSTANRGKLTNYSPRAGDPRVYIATIYDQNTLDYNPSPSYEIVV